MLAVHWSPVKNTKGILHNGIRKSKRGVFCFPLTGQPNLDKWWANAFRQWRPRTSYNGFVLHFGYALEADVKHGDEYERVGREIVARNPERYLEALDGDAKFLEYVFEDYQIVLSRSIAPPRILHIMSGDNDYGRNIARNKKEKAFQSHRAESD